MDAAAIAAIYNDPRQLLLARLLVLHYAEMPIAFNQRGFEWIAEHLASYNVNDTHERNMLVVEYHHFIDVLKS